MMGSKFEGLDDEPEEDWSTQDLKSFWEEMEVKYFSEGVTTFDLITKSRVNLFKNLNQC